MKRAEKLFVIHTADIAGGSSRSISGLIHNLNEDVDLLVNVDSRVSNSALKRFYGSNVRKIYRMHLPFRRSALGLKLEKEYLKRWMIRESDYLRDKKKIYNLIKSNGYHYIHLNSYVLYPLLTSRFPMYIHIREVFEGSFLTRWIIQSKLRQAKGIIYIDYVVKETLNIRKKREIILNNPFNQSAVLNVNQEIVRGKFNLHADKAFFVFITASSIKEKGLSYIIDEFIHSGCTQSELLIVGIKAPNEYRNAPNIHFLGYIDEMEEIYAISDFVIRGDVMFAVGRTIYEALYSGCQVMIPGNKARDKAKFFEYDKFQNQVMFYEPRVKGALSEVMRRADGMKKEKCLGLSNEEEYSRRFLQFIEGE